MDIKPFDIVKLGGENYRVQSVDECDKEIRLIGGYWVRESDITSPIKSFDTRPISVSPSFKIAVNL